MSLPPPTASAKPRKPRYPATAKRIEHVTPRMVRVTFAGPGRWKLGAVDHPDGDYGQDA